MHYDQLWALLSFWKFTVRDNISYSDEIAPFNSMYCTTPLSNFEEHLYVTLDHYVDISMLQPCGWYRFQKIFCVYQLHL